MNAHYRFYPLPRPSLKTEFSRHCSCSTPCNRESCRASEGSRNMSHNSESSSSSSTPPYPPQPPSPHVHFLGLCQTYLVDYDYDRSSTVVMPNECALPARGCPGKTYFSNTVAHVARSGRRLARCATPAASRANSRNRANNMSSPPPSPSFYAKHIFYPEEYPFPSPVPSPRGLAPQLVPDTCMSPGVSDDSDVGLSTPPEVASQVPSPPSLSRRGSSGYSSSGSLPAIDAPGHPPIPGLISPSPRAMGDMFSITNALNGLELTNGSAYDGTTPWSLSSKRSKDSDGSPKKVKSKKSKTNVRISPVATSFRGDAGVLGGF